MIDLNKEMSLTDTERSELILHLFDDMKHLLETEELKSLQTSEVYNHFVEKQDLPQWIRNKINKDFSFAAKLHELIIRYKSNFEKYPY